MERLLKEQFDGLEIQPSDSVWNRVQSNLPDEFEFSLREKLQTQSVNPNADTWLRIEKVTESLQPESENNKKFWAIATLFSLAVVASVAYTLILNNIKQEENKLNDAALAQLEKRGQTVLKSYEINLPTTTIPAEQLGTTSEPAIQLKTTISKPAEPTRIDEEQQNTYSTQITQRVNSNETTQPIIQQVDKKVQAVAATTPQHEHTTLINQTVVSETQNGGATQHNENPIANVGDQQQATLPKTADQVKDVLVQYENKSDEMPVKTPVLKEACVDSPETTKTEIVKGAASADTNSYQTNNIKPTELKGDEELSRFSITAIAGVNYCSMLLAKPSGSAYPFDENIALRNQAERPSFDFAFSFLVDYHVNARWRISSGVGRLLFNQNLYYNTTQPINPVEATRATVASGDSIILGESVGSNIRYTWTEIPIYIAYNFAPHKRIYFSIQTGISYARLGSVDAAMINYDNVGILILNNQTSFPGLRNNFFAHINPGCQIKLNTQTEIGINLAVRYALNSMIQQSDWVQQKPILSGIALSLRRRF